MPRLPTVKLKHKSTGAIRIVNQTDYARDISSWCDYSMISMRDGNATVTEVEFSAQQSDIDKHRKTSADREKRFGDKKRFKEKTAITVTSATAEAMKAQVKQVAGGDEKKWQSMKWFEARKFVREATGTTPRDKKHAEELMAAL